MPAGDGREPFYRVVQAGFRQRRKQVHNGLARELPVEREQVAEALRGVRRRPGAPAADPVSVDEWACADHRPRSTGVRPLRLEAPAKLNLSLRVVGRRDDGFHLLDSDLVLLELADELLADARLQRPARDRRSGRRACRSTRREPGLARTGRRARGRAGDGLPGAGEADSRRRRARRWIVGRGRRVAPRACVARAARTCRRWRAGAPWRGSAPTCRSSRPRSPPHGSRASASAWRSRRRSRPHVVLAHPPFGLPTAAVFAELRSDEWGALENDLLAPARRLRPELDDVLAAIESAGGLPRLSGSGPTIFSLAGDADRAAAIAAGIERAGIRATITRTRSRPAAIHAIDEED